VSVGTVFGCLLIHILCNWMQHVEVWIYPTT
jgi:hypothetical protein